MLLSFDEEKEHFVHGPALERLCRLTKNNILDSSQCHEVLSSGARLETRDGFWDE